MGQLRLNGGLIGAQRRPGVSTAPGVWSTAEHVVYARAMSWPGKSPIPAMNPIIWYDFADESTITLSGSQVASVTDKGSRGWTLTKSATGPTYTSAGSGINNLPCINWGSSAHSNYLRNTQTTSTNIAEIYVVLDASFGSTFPDYNGLITGTADPGWLIGSLPGGTGLYSPGYFDQAYVNNSASNQFSSVLPAINSPSLLRIKKSNDQAFATTNGIQVGNDRTNSGRGWYGLIGEIVIFPSILGSTDRATLQSFLASKWGLTLA